MRFTPRAAALLTIILLAAPAVAAAEPPNPMATPTPTPGPKINTDLGQVDGLSSFVVQRRSRDTPDADDDAGKHPNTGSRTRSDNPEVCSIHSNSHHSKSPQFTKARPQQRGL